MARVSDRRVGPVDSRIPSPQCLPEHRRIQGNPGCWIDDRKWLRYNQLMWKPYAISKLVFGHSAVHWTMITCSNLRAGRLPCSQLLINQRNQL